MKEDTTFVIDVLGHYGIHDARISAVETGLINQSWRVITTGGNYLVQHVNRIFDAEIHSDIARVTDALAVAGITSPRLLKTLDGQYCFLHASGIWRVYTYIEGITIDQVSSRHQANEAGRVLAQFHRVLAELDITFSHRRPGVHDIQRHLQHLKKTLDTCRNHTRYNAILPIATEILHAADCLPALETLPERKVHGDPKINNILFDLASDRAICMLDFDTMTNMPLALELGDAMRSWCNPAGEDSTGSIFEPGFFRAGLEGYLHEAYDRIDDNEIRSVLPATATIYIELASRFCADALNEDYFGWDPQRFDSHSQHSETRAMSQLNCYRSLSSQYAELEALVDTILQR